MESAWPFARTAALQSRLREARGEAASSSQPGYLYMIRTWNSLGNDAVVAQQVQFRCPYLSHDRPSLFRSLS